MFSLTLDLWRAFLEHFLTPQRTIEDFVRTLNDDTLPELINKASDQNPRIKQAAIEFIRWLAKFHPSFSASIYTYIVQLPKNPAASRLFRNRLELVITLLPDFPLSDTDTYLESIMHLVILATEHSHVEVREVGIALLKRLHSMVGSSRILHFTQGMKSSLFEVSLYDRLNHSTNLMRIPCTFYLVHYSRRAIYPQTHSANFCPQT
jgi:hypothetical protein